jgi:hypothetical protein
MLMKKVTLLCLLTVGGYCANAQIGVKYDPSVQSTQNMQYFKPEGDLSVGDCMPFYHDGTFSEYWLLDSLHGENLHGLGGHQWVLSTTTDLKNWKQQPIVLGIDEPWEKSICTGSVVFYQGKYYAFYATRLINNGQVNEQLSYAISNDGVHFDKQKPNPFYTSAPGYSKRDFRDPKVFVDASGEFHLFVASDRNNPVLKHAAGCLVHLSSKDLKTWTVHDPILTGQPSTPECPDYFFWKGWYYLVYSDNSNTYYVKSKSAYGPWEEPDYQVLNEDWANVVKTAEFEGDRRIATAWIPSRRDNKDNNYEIFGGNMVFREVLQEPDGTLDTRFPPEMIPKTGADLPLKIIPDLLATLAGGSGGNEGYGITIHSPGGVGAGHIENVPPRYRITFEAEPTGPNEEYGLYLKSDADAGAGYRLNFSAEDQTVSLGNTTIRAVKGLNHPVRVDIIVKEDIIDVNVDGKRCIVNRVPEAKGGFLWFYAKHGQVKFSSVRIRPLEED